MTGKFGLGVQNEAGQRLTEFFQEKALVLANTVFQQHKRWLYTWTLLAGQYQNQIDYTLCSWRWRSSIQSANTRLGADCGSDHELLIAKFSLKLKKAGKTIRPFRYDLNQVTYYYIVEMTNKFKGLDLINSAWRTVHRGLYIVQKAVIKTIPKKKKWKKAKWLSEEGLHSWEKKRSEKQRRKGKIYSSECRFPRNRKERCIHLNAS